MDQELIADAELDALLAAVDASGESLRGIPLDEVVPVSLDEASGVFTLDDDAWWVVDEAPEANVIHNSTQSIPTQVSTAATNDSNRAYGRVVASRRRAKGELEYLRRRVQELEHQLKHARGQPTPASSPSESSVSGGKIANGVDLFWQRLAQSEREARHRAVAENLKLRDQLEAQLRTARSLEKLFNKRPRDRTDEHASFKRLGVGQEETGSAIFASLITHLDTRYLQTDEIFGESGLADRREAFQDARVRFGSDTTGTMSSSCVEFVTSTVVPFDYTMTRDVAWRALQSRSIPLHDGVYEAVETTDDLVKAKFTVHTKLRESGIVSNAHFVARQYVQEDRTVVVWALASTIQGGILKNHRVELLEEGWSAISPLETDGGNDITQLSLTQACGRLRPRMVVRAGSKLDELVGLLTDVFLDCYHDTQQGLYDYTGRMLIDEAAKRR